jgi:hypothetical protein
MGMDCSRSSQKLWEKDQETGAGSLAFCVFWYWGNYYKKQLDVEEYTPNDLPDYGIRHVDTGSLTFVGDEPYIERPSLSGHPSNRTNVTYPSDGVLTWGLRPHSLYLSRPVEDQPTLHRLRYQSDRQRGREAL